MVTTTDLQKLAPFGVEADPDLILKPTEAGCAQLRRMFDEQGMLIFRDLEPLDLAGQIEVCSIFGPVMDTPWENFYVSNSRPDGFLGAQPLLWHHDLTYLPVPYLGGSLHALEVDDDSTSTQFVSGLDAWRRLPDALRERIDGLNALHIKLKVFDRRNVLTDLEPGDVGAVHAVAPRHERTGERYIFVNGSYTDSIIGLSRAESDALLEALFACTYVDEHVYEHRWRRGDLVIWDNRTIQHARGEVGKAIRTLRRVSIAEWGYAQMYPTDGGIHSDQYDISLAEGTGVGKALAG